MIDLNTHTKNSDGSSSTLELLEEEERIGLSLLSIADHNTIRAHYELQNMNLRNIFS